MAGGGSQTHPSSRWGDYSMMAVDATDGCTFWYTQEYYASSSERGWRTRVGAFGLPPGEPDVSAPASVVMLGPGATYQRDRTFTPSWNATDCQSGVAGHDVRVRVARWNRGFGPRTLWQADAAATSAAFAGAPGRTYCFDVRARDAAGNVSARSDERCTAVPLNDTALEPRGSWDRRSGGGHYLGTFSVTKRRGDRLIREGVRARRLAIVVTKCRRCGRIAVFFKGSLLKRVNLGADRAVRRKVVPLATFPSVRRGKVTVLVTSAGKPVKVEGLGVGRI